MALGAGPAAVRCTATLLTRASHLVVSRQISNLLMLVSSVLLSASQLNLAVWSTPLLQP